MHPGRFAVLVFACATVAPRLGDALATPRSGQAAQTPPKTATAPAIGMLEVPRLSKFVKLADGRWRERERGERVVLRRRASADSPIVATIASFEELEIEEFDAENSGALVFSREGNWSLLKTSAGGAGWLAPSEAGTFHPLESLLRHELTYLTDAWDGGIGASPGAKRVRLPSDPRKRMIGYLVSEPERTRVGSRSVELDKWILAFERPDPFAAIVARFQSPRFDHVLRGTPAKTPPDIMVFDRQPGWFQVALHRDDWESEPRVWIQDATVWRFHEVRSETERDRLAEEAWGREDNNMRVVGSRLVAGAL